MLLGTHMYKRCATIKGCVIGFFFSLCIFPSSTNEQLETSADLEVQKHTRCTIQMSPPFFKDASEPLNYVAIASPAYAWLVSEFIQAFSALSPTQAAVGLVSGYFAADLFSGCAHLTTDSWNPEIFPESLAKVFRGAQEHHNNPADVLGEGVWENNKKYHVASYVALGITSLLRLSGFGFASEILDVVILMNMWTGWFHACGHGAYQEYPIVRVLQRKGLLISKAEHGKHHKPPHERDFCVISGLMNPVLNRVLDVGHWFKSLV